MNLYKIMFEHYSQKDSQVGIGTYYLAENEEEVYEYIKSEPSGLPHNSWKSMEEEVFDIYNEDYEKIGTETYKEKIIRVKGEMFDEDAINNLSDLYYGTTLLGWEGVRYKLTLEQRETLELLGIVSK